MNTASAFVSFFDLTAYSFCKLYVLSPTLLAFVTFRGSFCNQEAR